MVKQINLRLTTCPVNFVRCKLELEKLKLTEVLQVDIDRGDPEELVISGLKEEGYNIQIILRKSDWIRLLIMSNVN